MKTCHNAYIPEIEPSCELKPEEETLEKGLGLVPAKELVILLYEVHDGILATTGR